MTWLEEQNKGRQIGWEYLFGEGGSASPKTMLEPARPRAADQQPEGGPSPLPTR